MTDRNGQPTCERVPPYDQDAEMAVLGCMMSAPDTIDDVVGILKAEMFYMPAHVTLYRVLSDMHGKGQLIDLLIVSETLRNTGDFDAIGGHGYMVDLADSFGWVGNAEHYARIVLEKHRKRELIRIGNRLTGAGYDVVRESDDVLSDLQTQVDQLSKHRCDEHIRDAADLVAVMPGEIQGSKSRVYITSGLAGLDDALGGIERGAMMVIGARPRVGKTSLSLSFALAASKSGVPSLFVSIEMSNRAIAQRIASAVSGEGMDSIRREMGRDELDGLAAGVVESIGHGKVFVARGTNDSRDICSRVRVAVRRYGVGLVVVDYLQLCRGPRAETRNLQIAGMCGEFKRLAVDSDVALVVLSQLSRGHDKEGKRPTLADLRDSGAIEQDADIVAFLFRDKEANRAAKERVPQYELGFDIAKNRNGPERLMALTFHPRTMTFTMGMGVTP